MRQRKNQKNKLMFLIMTSYLILVLGCGSKDATVDNNPVNPQEAEKINKWINDGAPIEEVSMLPTPKKELNKIPATGNNGCIERKTFEVRNGADKYVVFDPNAGMLWTGALVQTKTAHTGVLDPVVANRTPVQLTITGRAKQTNGEPLSSATVTMQNPSDGSYENLRIKLVGDGFQPMGKWEYSSTVFHSLSQAFTEIGISAEWLSGDVKASLSTSNTQEKSTLIYTFEQQFYTIAMSAPTSPSSVFANGVTAESLAGYSDPVENQIGYISSITYGRRIMMIISSSASMSELKAALEANASYMGGSYHGDFNTRTKEIINQSSIKILVVGVDPSKSVVLLGPESENKVDAIRKIFSSAPNDDLVTFGVPISYRINYLKNNQLMRLALAGQFDETREAQRSLAVRNLKVIYTVGGDGKDDNSHLHTTISKGGTTLATRHDYGTEWHQGVQRFPFEGNPELAAGDLAGATIQVCIDPDGNDKFEFGIALQGDQSNNNTYNWSSPSHWISQDNRCNSFVLPTPTGPTVCN